MLFYFGQILYYSIQNKKHYNNKNGVTTDENGMKNLIDGI